MNNHELFLNVINECLESKGRKTFSTIDELKGNNEIVENCVDCVSDVFMEKGLKDDYEPNEYGLLLEETIDYLNNIIYSGEKSKQ
jgi:hypothetical protein